MVMVKAKVDQIIHDYVQEDMSLARAARRAGVASSTARNVLIKAGIPIRSVAEARRLAAKQGALGWVPREGW